MSIDLHRHSSPRVSVIIPAAATPELLHDCLRSLKRNGPSTIPFEVIVVLNESTSAAEAELRATVTGIEVVASGVNLGMAGAGNRGRDLARGELLVTLHDDAEVEPGWLEALVSTADSHPEAGAVGGKVLHPDGLLQSAGMILWSDAATSSPWVGAAPPPTAFDRVRAVDYCGTSSLLVRADVWDAVGGLDERFYPAYYVDVDLAMAIRQRGLVVLYQALSRIRHHRSASMGPRFRSFVAERNRRRFLTKWSSALREHEPREEGSPAAIGRAIERAASRRIRGPLSSRPPRQRLDPALQQRRHLEASRALRRDFGSHLRRASIQRRLSILRSMFAGFRRFLLPVLALLAGPAAPASDLPAGFVETVLTDSLSSPTAMAIAPDGRIFVCEQGGDLRVVKNGALLAAPFVSIDVQDSGERGLLGVAFDPAFENNQFVYVYYTAQSPALHNRVSRFTAAGDRAAAGSEAVILDLDNLSGATNHNGGAIHFGPDGRLYVAVGENANASNSQSFNNLLGKILRIGKDGSIPGDNPFFGSAAGKNRAIWAVGLRNPFTFAFQNGTGRMFINDVGQGTFEEINDGIAGSNYGWPATEGPTTNPLFRGPIHHYGRSEGCAITGGTFYNPATAQFPAGFVGDYLFADFCGRWIRRFDPASGQVDDFIEDAGAVVDLRVGADGSLYYIDYGGGTLVRVRQTTSQAPQISEQPASRTVAAGGSATFEVEASGTAPLLYQWRRDETPIAGAVGASYTLPSASLADSGAIFRVVVSNGFGSVTSDAAILTVLANDSPVPTINDPALGALYRAGGTLTFAGTASDAQDGSLPASRFTWEIRFHHDNHSHPFFPSTSGIKSGSAEIPDLGETSANVFYRVRLTVRDSAGATATTSVDVQPHTSTFSFATDPVGLQITLDGQPRDTPFSVESVEGLRRAVGAPSPQTLDGQRYRFDSWSDGGGRTHHVATPQADTDLVARFVAGAAPAGLGLTGTYFDRANFKGATRLRLDRTVDFDWNGAPISGFGGDSFSVRWAGQVEPAVSGQHVFVTDSTDGARLWVDGRLVIDHWAAHGRSLDEAAIDLEAGNRYDLRLEFRDDDGPAVARLLWEPPGSEREVIPAGVLHPYALLIVGEPQLEPLDDLVADALDRAGFAPLVLPDEDAAKGAAANKALVVISDSAAAGSLSTAFRAVVNPVVTWNAAMLPVLGMTGSAAGANHGEIETDGRARVFPGHPLAAGLSGYQQLAPPPATFTFGQPNKNSIVVARNAEDPRRPILFAYERGKALPRFGAAPGRRLALFLNGEAGDLGEAGQRLLDAALLWAAGSQP